MIHAGLYYPAGTLKARLCVEGRRLMYDFCAAHGIPHARCGKIVVAGEEQEVAQLEALRARALANGVEGLTIVDRAFVAAREPHVHALAALYSPESGGCPSRPHHQRRRVARADGALSGSEGRLRRRPLADRGVR